MKQHGFSALPRFYPDQGYTCSNCGYSALADFMEHIGRDGRVPALFIEPASGRICCYKNACRIKLENETGRRLVPLVKILRSQGKNHQPFNGGQQLQQEVHQT